MTIKFLDLQFGTCDCIFKNAHMVYCEGDYDEVKFVFNGVQFTIDCYTSPWGRSVYHRMLDSVKQGLEGVYL